MGAMKIVFLVVTVFAVSVTGQFCNFDHDYVSECGYDNDPSAPMDWEQYDGHSHGHGHVQITGSGPTSDHTHQGGHGHGWFMMSNCANNFPGDEARLVSPMMMGTAVLDFWYNMNGGDLDLSVYLLQGGQEVQVFNRQDIDSLLWMHATIPLNPPNFDEPYQIVFETVRGTDPLCHVAIDDVNINIIATPTPPTAAPTTAGPTTLPPSAAPETQPPTAGPATAGPATAGPATAGPVTAGPLQPLTTKPDTATDAVSATPDQQTDKPVTAKPTDAVADTTPEPTTTTTTTTPEPTTPEPTTTTTTTPEPTTTTTTTTPEPTTTTTTTTPEPTTTTTTTTPEPTTTPVPPTTLPPGMTINCNSDVIQVVILRSAAPHLDEQTTHLNDPTCIGTVNDTHLVFETPLGGCGTTRQETENYIIYSNSVEQIVNVVDGSEITFTGNLDFHCAMSRERLVTGVFQPDGGKMARLQYDPFAFGEYDIEMKFYQTSAYQTELASPVNVPIGDTLYVETRLTSSDSNLRIRATRCDGTTTTDPTSHPQYYVIDNKCPTDGNVVQLPSPSPAVERFSMRAFQFLSAAGSPHYLHCYVLVCNAASPNSPCEDVCARSHPKARREAPNPQEVRLSVEMPARNVKPYGILFVAAAMAVGVIALVGTALAVRRYRKNRHPTEEIDM
ncbi:uncharacterized protein LOC144864978 [Branchiostoma floridae x Branchiostoma japonicum]